MLRNVPGGADEVVRRLTSLSDREVVGQAIDELERFFRQVDSVGSQRSAKFVLVPTAQQDEVDDRAADDRALVLDLVDAWRATRC